VNGKGMLGVGAASTVTGFIFLNTTLLAGLQGTVNGDLNLSQAHGLCSSVLGLALQQVSSTGAANCSTINNYYMFASFLVYVGIAAAIVGGITILYRRRPA
jgi:hypothetical protein